MADLLLVFPYEVSDKEGFENMICLFEDKGFIVHVFEGLNSNDFYLEILADVLEQLKENEEGINRIVVISNVKEIVFSWYRCYNSLVDEFVYFVDKGDCRFLDGIEDTEFIQCLSNFFSIRKEHIEGKIYFNFNFDFVNYEDILVRIVDDSNFGYLDRIENFDFNEKIEKKQVNKEYVMKDCQYSFINCLNENTKKEIIQLPYGKKREIHIDEDYLNGLLKYNINFLIFAIIGLYKADKKKMTVEFQNYFLNLSNIEDNMKKEIANVILNYIEDKRPAFVEKVHILSFLGIMKNRNKNAIIF